MTLPKTMREPFFLIMVPPSLLGFAVMWSIWLTHPGQDLSWTRLLIGSGTGIAVGAICSLLALRWCMRKEHS